MQFLANITGWGGRPARNDRHGAQSDRRLSEDDGIEMPRTYTRTPSPLKQMATWTVGGESFERAGHMATQGEEAYVYGARRRNTDGGATHVVKVPKPGYDGKIGRSVARAEFLRDRGISKVAEARPSDGGEVVYENFVDGPHLKEAIVRGQWSQPGMRKDFIRLFVDLVFNQTRIDDLNSSNLRYDTNTRRWEIVDGNVKGRCTKGEAFAFYLDCFAGTLRELELSARHDLVLDLCDALPNTPDLSPGHIDREVERHFFCTTAEMYQRRDQREHQNTFLGTFAGSQDRPFGFSSGGFGGFGGY